MYIDFILEAMHSSAEKKAIIYNEKVYTYDYLIKKVNFWIDFIEKNIGSNKVVAIQSEYNPDSITLLLALIEKSCIVVPFSHANKDVPEKIKIAEANFFFSFNNDKYTFERTGHISSHPYINQLVDINHPGIIIFSSGSTGVPKAALHDFSNLLNKFKVKRKTLTTINFLLFDHWGGLNTLFYILSNAGVIGIPLERTPNYVCEFIQKHKIELLPTTPTFLNLLILNEVFGKYDLSSLKMITYGTEPMYESTLKKICKELPNVEFKQTYGLTELGVFRTKSKSSDSLWLKVGGEDYQTKIVDDILFVKAKSSIIGYLNAPSPFDNEGWYNTGDKVEVDGEWIRFLGRINEVINVGGQKVFPAEVESVLLQLDIIKDCSVYKENNAILGNVVAADIVLNEELSSVEVRSIVRSFCKDKLENYKIPVKINIVSRTMVGERFKKIRNL